MKQILLALLTILISLQLAIAQSFSPDVSTSTVDVALDGMFYDAYVYLTNNSSNTLHLEWERTTNDLPEGWTSAICVDGESCWLPTVSASPDSENWFIEPGTSKFIKVQFITNPDIAVNGTANVVLRVRNENDAEDNMDLNFVGTSTNPVNNFFEVADVRIFPNPATDYIKLTNSANIVDKMEVFNMIGRKVKTFISVEENELYDISTLTKGIYLVRMINAENDVLVTKRISIK